VKLYLVGYALDILIEYQGTDLYRVWSNHFLPERMRIDRERFIWT
jgi:hypothetical protein